MINGTAIKVKSAIIKMNIDKPTPDYEIGLQTVWPLLGFITVICYGSVLAESVSNNY